MLNQTFVGRDSEMAKLEVYFDKVQTSQTCQVCLIEGNAGVGKTTLTDQFAQLLEKKYIGKAFTVVGKCNPQTGPNDNYLPFRQILSQFTGTQTRLLQNSISNRPNWFRNFSDSAILALVEFGPDLIGTFVPGATLMARLASTVASTSLKKNAESRAGNQEIKKEQVHDQYSTLLRKFAKDAIIVIVLDDLQWADELSLDLFVHLAKSLENYPVLFIGTYRSADKEKKLISIERDFQTKFGDITINLNVSSQETAENFTNLFLEANRCRVKEEFHIEFFNRTEGNALFSVELLRYLYEQKLLVQNEEGYWIEAPNMVWNKLPPQIAKLEGLIEARLEALRPELQHILDIASIEGQNFTAQVIMNFLEISEYDLLKILSAELEKKHHLVAEVSEALVGLNVVSNYRFVNTTFHQYIYNSMSLGQRRIRHKEVAETLEKLYENNYRDIASQLAHHYKLSYESKKVIKYLNLAGEQLINTGEYDQAAKVLDEALSLANNINDKKGIIDSEKNIYGKIWLSQQKYAEAEMQLLGSLNLARSIGYINGEIQILRQLGIIARRRDKKQFTKAVRFYLESLNLAKKAEFEAQSENEKIEAKKAQAQAMTNLGTIAMAEEAYDDAEMYFNERFDIAKQFNDDEGKLFSHVNLGDMFWRKGWLSYYSGATSIAKQQWLSSRKHLEQGLELGHRTGRKTLIASVERGLAKVSISETNYDNAKSHLSNSLSIVLHSGLKAVLLENLACAVPLLTKINQVELAVKLGCFVTVHPNLDIFYKKTVKKEIQDTQKEHPYINVDEIMNEYHLKNDKELDLEQENLARTLLNILTNVY